MAKDKTPFLRYRNGSELEVSLTIIKSLVEFLSKLGSDKPAQELLQKDLIKDIADGSGYGIHPDSTWYQTILELYRIYDRFEREEQVEVSVVLEKLLRILTEEKDIEAIWDAFLGELSLNFEALSGWKYSFIKRLGESENIQRDKRGKYFKIEEGNKIEILGTLKTNVENRFGQIAEDIQSNYGKISCILKFAQLVFISKDYVENSRDYSPELNFVLSDSDHNTWYLHGFWKVKAAYDLIPISWHPRNYFTDIEWLRSEAIAKAAKQCKVTDFSIPKVTETNDAIGKFEKAFEKYPLQYEVALQTNIIIHSEKGKDNPEEIYFNFEGKQLRWINGTKYAYPTLIVPATDESFDEEIVLIKKFISTLTFSEDIPIRQIFSVAGPKRFAPLIRQPRLETLRGLPEDIDRYIEKDRKGDEWLALSYYNEAVNSESDYYKYLCFYNCVRIAFLNDKNQEDKNTNKEMDEWIESQKSNLGAEELLEKLDKSSRTLGEYLRHEGGRNAIGHVGTLSDGNYPTLLPDNDDDKKKIQEILPIIKKLAEVIIKSGKLS